MTLEVMPAEIGHEGACGGIGGEGSLRPGARADPHFIDPMTVPMVVIPGPRAKGASGTEPRVDVIGRQTRVVLMDGGLGCLGGAGLRLRFGCGGSIGLRLRFGCGICAR